MPTTIAQLVSELSVYRPRAAECLDAFRHFKPEAREQARALLDEVYDTYSKPMHAAIEALPNGYDFLVRHDCTAFVDMLAGVVDLSVVLDIAEGVSDPLDDEYGLLGYAYRVRFGVPA